MAASARYLFAWCIVALLVVGTTFAQDDDDDDEEGEVSNADEGINCDGRDTVKSPGKDCELHEKARKTKEG